MHIAIKKDRGARWPFLVCCWLTVLTAAPPPTPHTPSSPSITNHPPTLSQDFNLVDSLAHFDRERIPERVVHAKGAGAMGYFEASGGKNRNFYLHRYFIWERAREDASPPFQSTLKKKTASLPPGCIMLQVTTPEAQKYCRAKLFSAVGKRTPVAVRFSTVRRLLLY